MIACECLVYECALQASMVTWMPFNTNPLAVPWQMQTNWPIHQWCIVVLGFIHNTTKQHEAD